MSRSVNWEESESLDFVTIAKAGGRKDLLTHIEFVQSPNKESQSYKSSVDWFAHPTLLPKIGSHFESPQDNSWMSWNPHAQMSSTNHKTQKDLVKLPKIAEDAVDFSRLLSLDYQREWLEERKVKQTEQKRKAKLKKAAQKRKLQEHTIKARKIAGVTKDPTDNHQERFIMKRFATVPAKVKLPPL